MSGGRRAIRSADVAAACRDFRCVCGSLLARITAHGVQLKCRRCKRTMLVPWAATTTPGRAPPASV